MSFKLSEWYRQHQEEQYQKQYITMPDGTEKHVTEFADKSVDYNTYKDFRLNSYAQDKFFPKLNDELLIERALYYITQCHRYNYPATTYDEALIHVVVPELIKRLREKEH